MEYRNILNMNLFVYLQLKEINDHLLLKRKIITLRRPWTHEFQWYFERI